MAETFEKSLAVVVGINAYANGISPLRSAVNDACEVARILESDHKYTVQTFLDQQATLPSLRALLTETLPATVGPKDRLLVYFAGHGVALDGDDGPEGYVVPQDARAEDPSTLLPMGELSDALTGLACRHFLLILDCCFAGAFRWTSTRDMRPAPKVLYRERFARFVRDPARQVLTSAGSQQRASDVERRFGGRCDEGNAAGPQAGGAHSPFALALLDALAGKADLPVARADGRPAKGDGVITATELYLYLRDRVEVPSMEGSQPQTPGLWPLPKHAEGEYVFLVPGVTPTLEPAPALSPANNPYRGLQSYSAADKDLFFGRTRVIEELVKLVPERALTVVAGASGSGKSSVVKAGLLPALKALDGGQAWTVLDPIRPSRTPVQALAKLFDRPAEGFSLRDAAEAWLKEHGERHLVVTIDQFEELITLCPEKDREEVLAQIAEALAGGAGPDAPAPRFHVVVTVRADFEPHFAAGKLKDDWKPGRYIVPPMSQNELREAILGPADVRVLYFEPPTLVDRIINEVVQMPGALPLLSFTLSELYLSYLKRGGNDRLLTEQDYDELGGVAVALRNRANEEYDALQDGALVASALPDRAVAQVDASKRNGKGGRAQKKAQVQAVPPVPAPLLSPQQQTMRRLLLRMVSLNGGELARRRVDRGELDYGNGDENARVDTVIDRLDAARLIVSGQDPEEGAYVEPAHDALIQGWDRLWKWVQEDQDDLLLRQRLTPAAEDWNRNGRKTGQLWTNDPRLKQAEAARLKEHTWLNKVEGEFSDASERQRKKNQRRLIAALSAALVIFAILAAVALAQMRVAQDNQVKADKSAATAVAESNIATSRSLAAQALVQEGSRHDLALLLAVQSAQTAHTFEAGNSLLRALQYSPHLVGFYYAPGSNVIAVAYPESGERWVSERCTKIAFREGSNTQVICAESELLYWELTSGTPVSSTIGLLPGEITRAAFSPDGRTLAVHCNATKSVNLYDVDLLPAPEAARPPINLGESDLGAGLALANARQRIAELEQALAVASSTGIELWEVTDGSEVASSAIAFAIPNQEGSIQSAGLSLDGKYVVGGGSLGYAGGAWIWETSPASTPIVTATVNAANERISGLAFSPDATKLALGGAGGTLAVGDVSAWGQYQELRGNGETVYGLAFSPDGGLLASGSGDSVWRFDGREFAIKNQSGPAFQNRRIPSDDTSLPLFDGTKPDVLRPDYWWLPPPDTLNEEQRAFALSEDGQDVIWVMCLPEGEGGCASYQVVRGPIDGGGKITSVVGVAPDVGETRGVALSPDGGTGMAIYDYESITLWDMVAQPAVSKKIALDRSDTLQFGNYGIPLMAVGPHGKTAAIGYEGGAIVLFDWETGGPMATAPPKYDANTGALAFSADGRTLASAGCLYQKCEIRLWDVLESKPVGPTISGLEFPTNLAVDNERQVLAVAVASSFTSSYDEVQLWDLATGRQLGETFKSAYPQLVWMAMDAGGTRLLTLPGGEVRDITPDAWAARACTLANRNLSQAEWTQYVGSRDYCKTCPDLPAGDGAPQDAPACAGPAGAAGG